MKTTTILAIGAAALAMTAATAKVLPQLHPHAPAQLVLASGDGETHGHNHGHNDAEDAHAGADGMAMAGFDPVAHGDLQLTNGFTFATLPNQPVGGGFVSITNDGAAQDRLIAVRATLAGRMEIHTMEMDGGVMKMRELPDGLAVPAGETVEMKPGGFHLMLMDLQGPLVEGETVAVTLTFETAGDVTVELPIIKRVGGAHKHHGGHDHGASDG